MLPRTRSYLDDWGKEYLSNIHIVTLFKQMLITNQYAA